MLNRIAVAIFASFVAWTGLAAQGTLPGTDPLTMGGDLSAQMVAGIDRFLERELAASTGQRETYWRPDFSSPSAYEQSMAANRERFTRMIGAVDSRRPNPELEFVATFSTPANVAETDRFAAHTVRWPVLDGVHGEGLLLQPKGKIIGRVVAIPDAGQTPEMISGIAPGLPPERQWARRLAESGCQVIVPVLANRDDTHSGKANLNRLTNQPHREWIYRQAFELGRHVIGYEVQKVRSAVDWLAGQNRAAPVEIGVIGWGEGGLIAFYSAAVDTRIKVAVVSGYFGPREELWREPIYRNLFGVLREFGDAGIARLIVPRTLMIEQAPFPEVAGPPPPRTGRTGAAPGRIIPASLAEVQREVERARQLAGKFGSAVEFHDGSQNPGVGPLAERTLQSFLRVLGGGSAALAASGSAPSEFRTGFDPAPRQERTVVEMEQYNQRLLRLSSGVREEFLWKKVTPATPEAWREAMRPYREKYWNEVIGRFPTGQIPLRPRSRPLADRPGWTGYEVVLDVLPDVYAWGYLLVPKGIKPGERRPVVVAQHGLEGLPQSVVEENPAERASRVYKSYAVRLAEGGFIVFAPHNPYRGGDAFRVLQRKANPLGKTLFGMIVAQHDCILDWLSSRPEVDPSRIGFYGLSYGGNSAMVLPAICERYALTINSGCFNDWIWKIVSTDWRNTYTFTGEYEKPDFNLGQTFGDAEIAALIAPRPFMVERGHDDGVGLDEWIGYEYAKVNRLYAKLKIPQLTEIEYFNGVHEIHGVGTYKFLHRHLNWPEPGPVPGAAGTRPAAER